MTKDDLTAAVIRWFPTFLHANHREHFDLLEVLSPTRSLSIFPNKYIQSLPHRSSWDFCPDVIAILRRKRDGAISLAVINRTTSSLSLKEIGELHCYAKLAKAELAFLVSTSGVSNEVGVMLVDQNIRQRLLNFDSQKTITIFRFLMNGEIDVASVIPVENRLLFNQSR